jgi:decaprenylphospho-beta-D-ribofuranose 2-oxidase
MTIQDCPDPPVSAPIQERHSYDGCHSTIAKVYEPQSVADLADRLRSFSTPERACRLTICAGNQSIDGQALGDRVVIQLGGEELSRIGAPQRDDHGWYVTVGAAAIWGDVLAALAEHGIIPYSVVTTSHATVGGTVSADCLSRSSPLTGREGTHVRSFRMLTVDGQAVECRRDDPDPERRRLFQAVIGGFGYLGVLTEVTIDVRPPLPDWESGRRIMAATRCDKQIIGDGAGRWADFLPSLRERVGPAELTAEGPSLIDRVLDVFDAGGVDPESLGHPAPWDAVSSAAWYGIGRVELLLFRSRYVLDRAPHPLPIYQRASPVVELVAMGSVSPALAQLGESALFALHPSGVYVDALADFTFFMENQITPAKQAASALGFRLDTIQQTFVLPAAAGPGDAAGVGPTARFLEQVPAVLFAGGALPAMLEPMRPTLIDVLYLPSDDFLLSATRGMEGYAVTLTFSQRNENGWDTLQERLHALSRVCHELGGRVHLVKDVVAEQPLLEEMYGGAFAELRALKRRYDPHGVLENGFYDRVFGGVMEPPSRPGSP